jgi:putative tricarboxylic transport membrane protein
MSTQARPHSPAIGETIIACCVLGLSAFIFLDERGISANTFGAVGPRVFPNVVALILAGLGCVLLFQALTGRWRTGEIGRHRVVPPLWILGGLLLEILLMQELGFVVSSTILFVCVARAFESRRLLRDVIAGLVLTVVTYLLFTHVLLLNLPAGHAWGLI